MPRSGVVSDRNMRGIVHTDKTLRLLGASHFEPQGVVTLFDDFKGDTLDANNWATSENGAATPFAISVAAGQPVAAHGGWIRAVTGAAAGNDEGISGEILWKPSRAGNGLLVFETRIATAASVASVRINAGLFDTKTGATAPTTLSGTTFTTNQTDGVGFVFDTDSTDDDWEVIGVKAGTDSVSAATAVAVAASTAYVLRIEVDSAGNAYSYFGTDEPDDVTFLGNHPNATTATVALAPGIHVEVDDAAAAAKTLDVDYVLVSCKR